MLCFSFHREDAPLVGVAGEPDEPVADGEPRPEVEELERGCPEDSGGLVFPLLLLLPSSGVVSLTFGLLTQ